VVLSLLAGCEASVEGNGDVVEDERLLQSFSAVKTWGAIRATVSVGLGQSDSVVIRTDRNLARFITTDVVDGVLEVGGERGRALAPTYLELLVSTPTLVAVTSEGWGDVSIASVDSDVMTVAVDGEGAVRLLGRANTLLLSSKDAGTFDGRRLLAKDVELDLNGNGDVYAYALDSIVGQTNGTGTVFVLGSPSVIDVRDYGGGDIRGDDE
jgi:hypothetical protein